MKIGDIVESKVNWGTLVKGNKYTVSDTMMEDDKLKLRLRGHSFFYDIQDFKLHESSTEKHKPLHSLNINAPNEIRIKRNENKETNLYNFNINLLQFCNDNKIDYPIGLIFDLLIKFNNYRDINNLYETQNILKSLVYANEK